jgi:hypothetical protein
MRYSQEGAVAKKRMAGQTDGTVEGWLEAAQVATQRGDYQEALEGFLRFHRLALYYEPSMYGVRLSFALSYWGDLAKIYPPALAAMQEVRDEAQAIAVDDVHKSKIRVEAFTDAQALNEELGTRAATVALYDTLARTAPKIAKRCSDRAFEDVAAFGDAALIRYCMGDPQEFIADRARFLTLMLAPPRSSSARDDKTIDEDEDTYGSVDDYTIAIQQAFAALTATGDAAQVPDLHRQAIDLVPVAVRSRVAAALNQT